MEHRELRPVLTIRLFAEEKCFGPGIAELLRRVRELKSLRAAAASMGMAYSKAWRIIRTAEGVFGCKLLSSSIGGKGGGGAVLTEEARRLLSAYDAYVADVTAYSQGKFEEAFGFYRDLSREGKSES